MQKVNLLNLQRQSQNRRFVTAIADRLQNELEDPATAYRLEPELDHRGPQKMSALTMSAAPSVMPPSIREKIRRS